jgi:succinoglycan biosynthesis protein ExoM
VVTDRRIDSPSGRIAVAIATYQRSNGLRCLLHSLVSQQGMTEPWRIVVVDNDADESAKQVVDSFTQPTSKIDYLIEPEPGIPAARNHAIRYLRRQGIEAVAFIDDDEWASPRWLTTLVNRMRASGVSAVSGPVEPVFPEDAPLWAYRSRLYHRSTFSDGAELDYASTANSIVRLDAIADFDEPFDERFRFTGGSDSFLFQRIRSNGHRIIWEPNALIYEHVPFSRITMPWIIRRSYRQGITLARCDRLLRKPWYQMLTRLFRGIVQFPLGMIDVGFGLLKGTEQWRRGLTRFARGAGVIAGLIGATYEEYRRGS